MEETKGKLKEKKTKQAMFYKKIHHVICHMTICLKILKLTKLVVGLRKEVKQYHFFIHINKFQLLDVWNESPLYFNKRTVQ